MTDPWFIYVQEMNSGFENEFYLLKNVIRYHLQSRTWLLALLIFVIWFIVFNSKNIYREGREEWVPFDRTTYCSTSGFDAASSILQEVNSSIESMDVFIEQVHSLFLLFTMLSARVSIIKVIRQVDQHSSLLSGTLVTGKRNVMLRKMPLIILAT